MFYSIVTIL